VAGARSSKAKERVLGSWVGLRSGIEVCERAAEVVVGICGGGILLIEESS